MVDLLLKQWIASVLQFNIQHVFVGLNNNIVLPKNDAFIVIQFLNCTQLQHAFYDVNKPNISELIASNYQIDFYRDVTLATRFYLLINSYVYPEWGNFIAYTAPKNLTNIDSTDRYIQRYSLDVTISHEINTTLTQETFTDVQFEFELIQ